MNIATTSRETNISLQQCGFVPVYVPQHSDTGCLMCGPSIVIMDVLNGFIRIIVNSELDDLNNAYSTFYSEFGKHYSN